MSPVAAMTEILECFRDRYTTDNATTLWMERYIGVLEKAIHEHSKKPIRSNSTPPKHQACGAGQAVQVPPIPRHTPKRGAVGAVSNERQPGQGSAPSSEAVSKDDRAIHDGTPA